MPMVGMMHALVNCSPVLHSCIMPTLTGWYKDDRWWGKVTCLELPYWPVKPWSCRGCHLNWSISLEVLIENPGIFKEAHIDYISYKLYSTHWKSIFPLQCLLQRWQLWYWYQRRSFLANKCTYILYDTCNYRHIQSNHLPLPLLAKQD